MAAAARIVAVAALFTANYGRRFVSLDAPQMPARPAGNGIPPGWEAVPPLPLHDSAVRLAQAALFGMPGLAHFLP